jgi:6-phosphogluconolactonase (cycloisomerase 2 family)
MVDASRRELLAGAIGTLATLGAAGCMTTDDPSAQTSPAFAYVGCYTTTERRARGEGLGVYRIDRASGDWARVQLLRDLVNPSWLTFDRSKRRLYSLHGDGEHATAFLVDWHTGRLTLLNRQVTGGRNGVSAAVDPTGRFLVVGNYTSGTVGVLPINPDGSLGAPSDVVALAGAPGPHRTEQASSHPHDVLFDRAGRFLLVPDKGFDRVFVFSLDGARGKLVAGTPPSIATRPGAGPRHVDFHPSRPWAYVINELDSTITAYTHGASGELKPIQVITTLPPNFTGHNTTSEIAVHPSGRFVYGSNRGHDSIAIFRVDELTGSLTPVGWEPTQGKTPRVFALDPAGGALYAANQDSDTVVFFRIDRASGALSPTGQVIKTGSPSSIVFR